MELVGAVFIVIVLAMFVTLYTYSTKNEKLNQTVKDLQDANTCICASKKDLEFKIKEANTEINRLTKELIERNKAHIWYDVIQKLEKE